MGKKLKNKASQAKKKFSHMSKKKKVLIGAGVAAVAVAGIAGTLYVGKTLYDKKKKGKAGVGGGHGTREVVDDGPESPALAPYHQAHPKTFMETSNIPDAILLGLSYDDDTQIKLNLLASVFDSYGQNLGYIQAGGQLMSLFNNAIQHTGDSHSDSIGDHENIVVDLRALPQNVTTIMFGTYLVNPPATHPAKAHIHMLPMIRNEQIEAQKTQTIEYDSDEDSSSGGSGTRGIGDDDDEEEDFVRLYLDDLDAVGANFYQQRGFVGGKIFRDQNGWHLTPFRTVVPADPNAGGLWPAFEHYAKPSY